MDNLAPTTASSSHNNSLRRFRRALVTREATKYYYVLIKLPEDVVMSVGALVTEIQVNPVLEDTS